MTNPGEPREIDNGRHWIGQTNREIRDTIEQGSKEIDRLRNEIDSSSTKLSSTLHGLTSSIEKISADNDILAKRSFWLAIAVGFATIVMASIAFIQFTRETTQANIHKAANIQAIKTVLCDLMQTGSVSATKHLRTPVGVQDILDRAHYCQEKLLTLSGNPELFSNERALIAWEQALAKTRAAEAIFFSDGTSNISLPHTAANLLYSITKDMNCIWAECIGGPDKIHMDADDAVNKVVQQPVPGYPPQGVGSPDP